MKLFIRRSPGSALLQTLSSLLLVYVVQVPVFFISCQRDVPSTDAHAEISAGNDDTPVSAVVVCGGGQTDLFVYDADGARVLEHHERFTSADDTILHFRGKGNKIAIAVTDCPFAFNLDALRLYDSIEMLRMELENDNADHPVKSATGEFLAGEDCFLCPSPSLCSIELAAVNNECGKYCRLEDPRMCLVHANSVTEILRQTGFTVNYVGDDTLHIGLGTDIGSSLQYPAKKIFCYPNDREPTIGTPATEFILTGSMNGTRREYKTKLPPFGRGAAIKLYLEITAPDEYSYRIF